MVGTFSSMDKDRFLVLFSTTASCVLCHSSLSFFVIPSSNVCSRTVRATRYLKYLFIARSFVARHSLVAQEKHANEIRSKKQQASSSSSSSSKQALPQETIASVRSQSASHHKQNSRCITLSQHGSGVVWKSTRSASRKCLTAWPSKSLIVKQSSQPMPWLITTRIYLLTVSSSHVLNKSKSS
jgi:hypothetical protein